MLRSITDPETDVLFSACRLTGSKDPVSGQKLPPPPLKALPSIIAVLRDQMRHPQVAYSNLPLIHAIKDPVSVLVAALEGENTTSIKDLMVMIEKIQVAIEGN